MTVLGMLEQFYSEYLVVLKSARHMHPTSDDTMRFGIMTKAIAKRKLKLKVYRIS